ncbi:hypothetical protein AB0L80_40200 [Streptomyces sp. NPDC052069]|uniref:hypothetical protein n=1 Tax=Streptomyces sp. NPDC052069 TaxID=3154650 RepID=UPI0034311DCF
MTAKATAAPPITRQTADELELRRWTPEEVIAKKLLPYRSARVLKEKCYRREVHCHLDGGRISFTAADIRAENARTAVVPLQRVAA